MAVKLNHRDYIWSYIGVFVSVGSSAIMLPFILHFLSEDMYGLWSVFQSVAAITALFDFGFSTTFARNINYCWCGAAELKKSGAVFSKISEPNFLLMNEVMTACRYVFFIISSIALICMAGPGTFYIRYISREIAGGEPLIAWGFYVVAVFLNLYYGYFNSFLRGVGAISDANRVTVIARLIQIILTVVLLACGFGIIGTGIAYLFYGFLLRMLSKRAFFRFRGIGEGLHGVPQKVSRENVKSLFLIVWHNASKEGLVTLSEYLVNQAFIMICPLYMSLSITGIYSMAIQLSTVLASVAGALYNANQPVLQSAYISNDKPLLKRTLSLIVVSFAEFYVIGLTVILAFGLPILRLIKPQNTPSAAIMLGAGIYQFVLKIRNCYASYFSCTNRIPYVTSYIISSAAGIVTAFILLRFTPLQIWALLSAQLTCQCAFNVWYWPVKAHRELELSVRQAVRMGNEEVLAILNTFFHGFRRKIYNERNRKKL